MSLPKNTVVCLFGALIVAGCAGPQKKIIYKPVQDSTHMEQPVSHGGVVGSANTADTIPREVVQPSGGIVVGQEQPETRMTMGLPLPVNYINERISEFEGKLERWREIDRQSDVVELSQEHTETMVNCFVDLQKIIDGYKHLKDEILQNGIGSSTVAVSYAEAIALQKSDIVFLESVCGRLLAPEGKDIAGQGQQQEEEHDLYQLEVLIENFTDGREYEEVVQVWQRIPEQLIERVQVRTKILYGNALMFLHQEEEAAEVYQQVVDQKTLNNIQSTDLLFLRKMLADLYTAAGNYQAAENQYMNISQDYKKLGDIEEWSRSQLEILEISEDHTPELVEYSGLLRNFLGFIPERDGFTIVWGADRFLQNYPYSAVASNVAIIKTAAQLKAEEWFENIFLEVERIVAEKNYLEAIDKLENIPEDIVSIEQQELIKAKSDDLILAEAVGRETRKIEKMQEWQRQWNEGIQLVEEGKYDEGIAIFQALLQTEYSIKAEDKIEKVTLLAAKADRRAAADLYYRYTKAPDFDTKAQLLTESRQLLSGILTKYPGVKIIDKVKRNIEKVEQEMNLLDPMLLPRLKAAELEEQQKVEEEKDEEDLAFSQSGETEPSSQLEEEDLKF